MRIVVFEQWDRLVGKFRAMADGSAEERSRYAIARVLAKAGRAQLADRTANVLAVEGGETTVVMPDIEPGKARDFMLRVTASGENALSFEGADAFEGESDALEPPGDGETAVYFFTETAAGVLLVARKIVREIVTEGGE